MQTTTLLILGFGLLLSVMLAGCLIFVFGRVRDLTLEMDTMKQRQAKIVREIKNLRERSNTVDERFAKTHRQLSEVRDNSERMHLPPQNQAAYSQAVRMIERGEPLQEIINVCGLSAAETDLLCKLHQKSKPTNPEATTPVHLSMNAISVP